MNSPDRFVRTSGWVLCIGSLVGAACAVGIIAWPPEVPPSLYSYPFSPGAYAAAQVIFCIRHLTDVVGVVGLMVLLWAGASRMLRAGLVLSLVGFLLFAVMEIVAITAATATADSTIASIVNTGYALPTLLVGIGLVLAGIALARGRQLPGASGRWLVLICGVYLFVPLFPTLFAPMVIGRIAIGVWLLLFAGLGLVLVRAAQKTPVRVGSATV